MCGGSSKSFRNNAKDSPFTLYPATFFITKKLKLFCTQMVDYNLGMRLNIPCLHCKCRLLSLISSLIHYKNALNLKKMLLLKHLAKYCHPERLKRLTENQR